jgi:hypothetical protein
VGPKAQEVEFWEASAGADAPLEAAFGVAGLRPALATDIYGVQALVADAALDIVRNNHRQFGLCLRRLQSLQRYGYRVNR